MKILSIAIPTYNMESYLPRCINSLIVAESILPYLEIIIVNDGSRDRSLEIAQAYQKKYPKSILVIDKKNGNYGSCINMALEVATGKYFRILDADDWINTQHLGLFIDALNLYSVDMIFTHYIKFHVASTHQTINKTHCPIYNQIIPIDSKDIGNYPISKDLAMHKITYKTAVLQQMQYKQTEGISYTDLEYVLYPLGHISSVLFLNLNIYCYFLGREGQTMERSARINHSSDLVKIVCRITEEIVISNNPIVKKWQQDFITFIIAGYYHILLVFQKLNQSTKVKLTEFEDMIYSYDPEIYERVGKIKCMGMMYIKIWRKYHLQIISPAIYFFIRRLIKTY